MHRTNPDSLIVVALRGVASGIFRGGANYNRGLGQKLQKNNLFRPRR